MESNIRNKRKAADIGGHDDAQDAGSASFQGYPRRRVAVACEVCRLRKTRCDAQKPSCSLCTELEIECVYKRPGNGLKSQDKRIEPDTATSRRLENIEVSLTAIVSALSARNHHRITSDTPRSQLNEHLSTSPSSFPLDGRHQSGCKMPNLLFFSAPFPESNAWSYNCKENFFSEQMDTMADLRSGLRREPQNLDMPRPRERILQRSFADNLLRWLPLFDHATASTHFSSVDVADSDSTPMQSLVLLMYAIGEIAANNSVYASSSHELPGFSFYSRALAILERFPSISKDLCIVQCWVLATAYLLFAMRPLEAWRTIGQASQTCVLLLKAGIGFDASASTDTFKRIYWICYVLENELEVCLELNPSGLRAYEALVPLPTSHYEEEGMYHILALSSLRRLMVVVLETVGLRSSVLVPYAPVIALELRNQIDNWFQHLPGCLQFPLDHSLLFNSRKAYLKCQYFALIAVVSWPFVFKCTNSSYEMETGTNDDESDLVLKGANECLQASRDYLKTAEEILTEKSLVSHLVIRGYFATAMILLLVCPSSPSAWRDFKGDRKILEQAIRNLAYWNQVPFMVQPLQEMERIAQLKGLAIGLSEAQA